jgi:hypothetical protein
MMTREDAQRWLNPTPQEDVSRTARLRLASEEERTTFFLAVVAAYAGLNEDGDR